MTDRSAFGCDARTLRSSGSSSGDVDERDDEPSRAMRENTRLGLGRFSVDGCRCRGAVDGAAGAAGAADAAAPPPGVVPWTAGDCTDGGEATPADGVPGWPGGRDGLAARGSAR